MQDPKKKKKHLQQNKTATPAINCNMKKCDSFHQGFLYFVLAVINGNSFKQYHDFYRMSLTAQMILFRRELRKIVIHLNNKATNK